MKKINNFTDFINTIDQFSELFIYRGVSKSNYKLIPSIARNKPKIDLVSLENSMMLIFKKQAQSILKFEPKNELEWLSLAQHHGLPTRLLDWSTSPLVALFFQ